MRLGKFLTAIGISTAIGLSTMSMADPRITGTIPVSKKNKAEWPSLAKITLEDAQKIALAEIPGQLYSAELDDENGYLVYDVEVIDQVKNKYELLIDAGDGRVLHKELDN